MWKQKSGPRAMDDEKQFIRKLSSKSKELDKPEVAVGFARLLVSHGRLHDALLIVRTALEEGPRYDLYEMRASGTHLDLDRLWKEIHAALGVKPDQHSTAVYNEGLHTPDPDWNERLKLLDGS